MKNLMLKSTQKIFETARACFFQHGYTASSIAMISRYANISRVTIHKQFSSKEILFRAFIQNFLFEKDAEIIDYVNEQGPFWQDTYHFLSHRCTEIFDEIPSTLIKSDLIHAGHTLCEDLINEERSKTRLAIQTRLSQAIEAKQISLDAVNLGPGEFAKNIQQIGESLMLSNEEIDTREVIKTTFCLYETATLPKS